MEKTAVASKLMRALYLSDLHFKEDPKSYVDAVDLVKSRSPDILLLGGDYEDLDMFKMFLREAQKHVDAIILILGNNDPFTIKDVQISSRVIALDCDAVWLPKYDILILGISRNVALRPRPYRRTLSDYIACAKKLGSYSHLPFSWKVLLVHEVPTEIAEEAVKRRQIVKFQELICGTASDAVHIIDPDVVFVGHLHAGHMIVRKEGRPLFVLATWTIFRCYVECTFEKNFAEIVVRKYPSEEEVVEQVKIVKS